MSRRAEPGAADEPTWSGTDWAIPAALCLLVAAIYAPVRDYPFVVFDDYGWIVDNPLVSGGLSWQAFTAAFTESVQGNWVPLTWLSYQFDISLFGVDAGALHVVNVFLHAIASLLVFAALHALSGMRAPSAFVALAFAVHPLHVESVAWVSERRDVLSGLFFALSLFTWARYAKGAGPRWFIATLAAFSAGLLAKPMLVTLPIVLLLLDYWPLERSDRGLTRLLIEKLPFVGMAGLVAAATLASQSGAGAVVSLDALPLTARISNALQGFAAYIGTSIWPTPLAVFYPYPDEIAWGRTAAAAAALAATTLAALREARRRPWLLVGWLWFAVTLVPVIGLVQVGSQARADRYMYLPLLGLSIAVAFSAPEIARRSARHRNAIAVVASIWLIACVALAHRQVTTWRDSTTLFEHARTVSGDSPIILVNLGEAYERAGDPERAIALYEEGLVGYAHAPRVRTRLAALLVTRGRLADAAAQLEEALFRHPDEPHTRFHAGRLLLHNGQPDAAAELLAEENTRFPGSLETQFHLAEARAALGERSAAVSGFASVWEAEPAFIPEPVRDGPAVADAMAQALADLGHHQTALHWTRRGLLLARLAGDTELIVRLENALPARTTATEGR